jgi:hypothetical protein
MMNKEEIVYVWMESEGFWGEPEVRGENVSKYWNLWRDDTGCWTYINFVRLSSKRLVFSISQSGKWEEYIKKYGLPKEPGRFQANQERLERHRSSVRIPPEPSIRASATRH